METAIGNSLTSSSWWFFTNPFQKYAQVKLDHLTGDRDENKKYSI